MRLFWNKPSGNAITAHALDNGSDFSCAECRVSLHNILMQLHSNTAELFSPKTFKLFSYVQVLTLETIHPWLERGACRVLVRARTIRGRESGGRLQALWSLDCIVPQVLYVVSHPLWFWSSKANKLFLCRSSWGKRISIREREREREREWGSPAGTLDCCSLALVGGPKC